MVKINIAMDMSEANDFLGYIQDAAGNWPIERQDALRNDVVACLEQAVNIVPERGSFLVSIGQPLFDVLKKHGIAPQLPSVA